MNPYYIAVGIGIVIGACGTYMMRNRPEGNRTPKTEVTTPKTRVAYPKYETKPNPQVKPSKLEMLINPPIENSPSLEIA